MAIQWDFKKKIGTWTVLDKDNEQRKYNLYKGNAFMIMLYEYKEKGEDLYNLVTFWVDKYHMKNCLGAGDPMYDFIYNDWIKNEIVLYRSMTDRKWIKDFSESVLAAFDDVSIRMVNKEGDEEK